MILIVDDKPENIFSLRKVLELNNFQVDAANSGEEALKKILKNSYALIILDVQMPVMDGFEVAEAISGYSKAKDIPIIFLSAVNTDKRFITKGYSSGGMDYITKPVDPDILLLKVKTFYRLYEQKCELTEIHKKLRAEIETRKNAQLELDSKVQELHSVLESMPQIAFTLNTNGQIEYVNERWYDYAEQASHLPEVDAHDVPLHQYFTEAMTSGQPLIAEVRIKQKKTSKFRYHLLKILPIKQGTATVKWVGTFTDIHQQKVANELLEQKVSERTRELRKSNQDLEDSNYELQQFASVASHDLKEPLRKINVFSSMIKDKYLSNDHNSAIRYIDRIIESAQRMNKLINDLLNYSRLSASMLYVPTDLNDIVKDILADLEVIVQEKEAVIDVGILPVIDAIPGQMRQVFQNLISNALKFTRKVAQPEISIKAEIVKDKTEDSPAGTAGDYCRIIISDNGIGFNERYLDKIFTLFQRLNSREEYEGTGIGLAVTKKIIDRHNGLITARSKEDEGSSFILVLPLHQRVVSVMETI